MSYEIYYDRAFIKVGDKFIPMLQHGSNNCWECSWKGRDLAEKNWHCENYPYTNKFLFTADEIKEIATKYDTYENFKSRHAPFEKGEFQRWYINGMKGARTVEEWTALYNDFYVVDYTDYEYGVTPPTRTLITTTDELLEKLSELKGKNIDFGFYQRDVKKPKRNIKRRERQKYDRYYGLKFENSYLYKLRKYGYSYTWDSSYCKAFKDKKSALSYVQKYADRLKGFEPVLIEEERYI